jgi:hypothetical protein
MRYISMRLNRLNKVEEDIEVGVESHTEDIIFNAYLNRDSDLVSTDYHVDIDEQTKNIVITPKDSKCFFSAEETDDVIEIQLSVNMLADDNNFEYEINVDNIGQLVISPKSDTTEFISVINKDNLNLITDADEPYDDSVCEEEIEYLTNNYTYASGDISTTFETEKDCAVNLLSKYYDVVDANPTQNENGTRWCISYSSKKPFKEEILKEDAVIGDEEGDQWDIKYEFSMDESLNESDEDDSSSSSVTVVAPDAETALKYAEQYARMQRRSNDKWDDAEVVAVNKR